MVKNIFITVCLIMLFITDGFTQTPIIVGDIKDEYTYDPVITKSSILVKNYDFERPFFYSLAGSPYRQVTNVSAPDGNISAYRTITLDDLNLNKDSNIVKIANSQGILQGSFNIYYSKPKVDSFKVYQVGQKIEDFENNNIYIVTSAVQCEVAFQAFTERFIGINDGGDTSVKQIRFEKNGNWNVKKVTAELGEENIYDTIKIDLDEEPGANFINFSADGTYKGVDEHGDTTEICIFYVDFNLPKILQKPIWEKDTLIKLDVQPEGGWYSGSGIVGNSKYFNPKNANLGQNIITYYYPLDDIVISVEKEINVLKSPEFEIDGDFWVCNNSKGIKYNIEEISTNREFDFRWDLDEEYGLLSNDTGMEVTIDWNENEGVNFVEITVIPSLKNDPKVKFEEEKCKVYFTGNKAYEKPALDFGDADHKLVICSNDSAFNYLWEVDGNGEMFETRNNFKYFNSIEDYAEVTLLTKSGCKTTQILYKPKKSGEQPILFDQKSSAGLNWDIIPGIKVFPNPANDYLNIESKDLIFDSWRIINTTGQIVKQGKVSHSEGKHLKIPVFEMIDGVYILNLSNNKESNSVSFILQNR